MMIAPITSAPDGIGTPSHDSVCVTPGASDSVVVAACSAVVPSRSGRPRWTTMDVRPVPSGRGSMRTRRPVSMK